MTTVSETTLLTPDDYRNKTIKEGNTQGEVSSPRSSQAKCKHNSHLSSLPSVVELTGSRRESGFLLLNPKTNDLNPKANECPL